jgi:hypothetical protein
MNNLDATGPCIWLRYAKQGQGPDPFKGMGFVDGVEAILAVLKEDRYARGNW